MLKLVNNNDNKKNNCNSTKSNGNSAKKSNNQRSTLITNSYKLAKKKNDEEDSSDETEIAEHEEFDAEGAPSEDHELEQLNKTASDLQQADNCNNIEDRLSLLVKAAERINATTTTSKMSNDKNSNTHMVMGKNGKPIRPFNACKKEPSVPNGATISHNNSANNKQIPLNVENSQQQQQQQQQQNNLLQLLSQHLAQQKQGNNSPTNTGETTTGSDPNKNPQVVINLEDVLNMIMNAASIVSSQSTPQPVESVSPPAVNQPQAVSPIPNNQHEIPKQITQTQATSSVSQVMSNPSTSPVNTSVMTTPYDDIISQQAINTYIGLDNNYNANGGDLSEFSSLDSLTKMSLMSSNDFCSQYKKRIQQAKERMIQKRMQEEELARQQEMNDKARNARKSRKRTLDLNGRLPVSNALPAETEDQPTAKTNCQHSEISEQTNVPGTESSADIKSSLVKMFLMKNGNSQSNMSEKQQGLFQMVLSALAMNEDTAASANGNGAAGTSPLNGLDIESAGGDALLNSYPPKKRHRMQQQQEQLNNTNQYGCDNMHEITSMTAQQNQQMEKQRKETQKRMFDETNKNEISVNVNGGTNNQNGASGSSNNCQNGGNHSTHNGCSLSSSSSSISTSPTPQSSPSLYMDSASSSSSYGVSSVNNNLNRIEINSRENRPSRDQSRNSSNSSSRSNSNNASTTRQQTSSSSSKQQGLTGSSNNKNNTNSMEAQLARLPRRESRTVIDIDQMSEGPDKDEAYRERRRKNNEAAKRSRDARRAKEDDIALRAAILERENLQLKVEVSQLKQETNKLRCLLYNS